ncbi:galactose-1-phosphate uridylyltransferase [Desulfurobacterium atlanticum]|uniref:UDPglucose--hexose-1-phosphate uridylyltransferase n=1 Tax=Desulfurobacterium atlanticum TaxID=240169 RepID=A0A239A626_9BACT|nr:DUF4931 domain-containing protein [Desulfurobacterium atlanticum]SNR90761.1 UDPglucose--hexose-1-phosphate uridylyltransferase [Desulfurobacterium atlanticum]
MERLNREIRYNYLFDRWTLISADRGKRPTDFKKLYAEKSSESFICPFDAGNEHLTPREKLVLKKGNRWIVRVVENKFPAVENGLLLDNGKGFFKRLPAYGYHEVVIETPEHSLQLQDMSVENIFYILKAWKNRIVYIKKDKKIKHVQIFKNYKKEAGCSLSHSHSQIVATSFIPSVQKTLCKQFENYNGCYLCDEIEQEISEEERMFFKTENVVAYLSFAPQFEGEFIVAPLKHIHSFEETEDTFLVEVARSVKIAISALVSVFNNPPYNLALFIPPFNYDGIFHWHIRVFPRISFHAGFEISTGTLISSRYPEEIAKLFRSHIQQLL